MVEGVGRCGRRSALRPPRPRAATRFEKNTTAPFVKVRIAGREFDHVRAEPAPEVAERVAAAMAAKYWSDLLHPVRQPSAYRSAERAPAMK